jgi:vacuolar-type H+-ATPase subunit I/STV1
MSSEPRMRGRRFRRPSPKKHSRERREEPQDLVSYTEETPIDPSQVSMKVLNALEHLGAQRFALPPFSEHFERWIKDLEALLGEFETELSNMVDEVYRQTVQNVLSSLRDDLRKQVELEKDSSGQASRLLQELKECELELSNHEREYGTRTNDARKRNERALGKLTGEINELSKRRLKLLQKRSSFIERILHRPEAKIEENTNVLQSKRDEFDRKGTLLQAELTELRSNFEAKRKQLRERQEILKAKLTEFQRNASNDALEIRNTACQQLRVAIGQAFDRSKSQLTTSTENIQ